MHRGKTKGAATDTGREQSEKEREGEAGYHGQGRSLGGAMNRAVLAGILGLGLLGSAVARTAGEESEQPDNFAGAFTYRTYCARCHGNDGSGDGPAAENLAFQPPDLRTIARRNKGQFPAERVRKIVDGRKPVKGYNGSGMPAFGDVFREPGAGFDTQLADLQIRAVVAYVQSLQLH